MITKYTNKELEQKIVDLKNSKFKKCKILNSKISDYLNLKCNWDGCEYTTNVYLETLLDGNLIICVSGNSFEFTNKGIEEAVKYINE
jgi:hypothetical protein